MCYSTRRTRLGSSEKYKLRVIRTGTGGCFSVRAINRNLSRRGFKTGLDDGNTVGSNKIRRKLNNFILKSMVEKETKGRTFLTMGPTGNFLKCQLKARKETQRNEK